MRFRFVPLTCLALLLLASPVMAKEKKHGKANGPAGDDGALEETGHAR